MFGVTNVTAAGRGSVSACSAPASGCVAPLAGMGGLGCLRLGGLPRRQCSFHRDDDLALGASLVDVGQGFLGGLEREDAVEDGADDA